MNETPNPASIALLKQHPELASQFDQKFGAGSSAQILQPTDQPEVNSEIQQATAGQTPANPVAPEGQPVAAAEPTDPAPAEAPTAHVQVEVPSTSVDMLKGVLKGAMNSVENSGDLMTTLTDKLGIPSVVRFGKDASNGVIDMVTGDEANKAGNEDWLFGKFGTPDNVAPDTQTRAGGLVSGVSQFVTSMIGAGKLLKPIEWGAEAMTGAKAVGTVATLVKGAAQGATADFAGFDPQADRLSNLIQQYPALQNPVTEYLAAKPDDGEVEGRVKNALEGLGLGAVVAPFMKSLGAIYKSIKAGETGGAEASAKAFQNAMPEVETAMKDADEAHQLDMFPEDKAEAGDPAAPGAIPAATTEGPQAPVSMNNRAQAGVDEAREKPAVDVAGLAKALSQRSLDYFDIGSDPEFGKLFNFDKFESGGGAQDVMRFVAPEVEKVVDKQIQAGTYTFAQMQTDAAGDLSKMMDVGTEQLLGNTAKIFADPKQAVAHLLSAKMVAQSLGRNVAEKITKIEMGTATDQEKAFFVKNLGDLVDLQTSLKVAQKTAARMTAAGRITTKDAVDTAGLNAADILDVIKKQGDDGIKLLAAKVRRAEGDPQQILGMIKGSLAKRSWDVVNEYYVNSLLSGVKTHIANISSNTFNLAYLPAEKIVSGIVTADTGPMLEGLKLYKGYATASLQSVKLAAKAFRMGDNVLDPAATKIEQKISNPSDMLRNASRYAIYSTQDNALGSMIRGFGTAVRMPSRLLTAEDEFFKQLTYRSQLQADLEMKAMRMFPKDRAAQSNFVDAEFKKAFDPSGKAVVEDGSSAEKAMDFSREATFTQDLNDGTFGKSLQTLTAKHPAARLILPFVKTPINIMRFVWTRTPGLNLLQKEFRDNLMAGGESSQRAMGQMATGSALYIAAVEMANRGALTGGGPSDPKLRQQLMDTGWRPYSFQVRGDDGKTEYVSYQRLAPWATFLGMTADMKDMAANMNDQDLEQLGTGMAIALANNVTNQSFLQGVTNFLDALSEPDQKMDKFVQKTAAGFVPTGLMQLANLTGVGEDPYMREASSVLDAMKAKIPGLSTTLPPKRSWMTGDPVKYPEGFLFPDAISPMTKTTNDGNVVLNELAKLNHGFNAPSKMIGNIELTPQQYDRLTEINGTVKIYGKTMMEALEHTMKTPRYDIDRKAVPDAPEEYQSGRLKMVTKIIGEYRQRAQQVLLKEQPDLQQKARDDKRMQAKVYRGDTKSAQDFLDSLK